MSDQTRTSDNDPLHSMSLATLICVEAAQLYKQVETPPGEADAPTTQGSASSLVDALEQAMVDLGYSRTELQRIWLVFLAGHRAAARAADRLPLSEEKFTAALAARKRVCPLQDEDGCVIGSLVEQQFQADAGDS
ncbi:MAG TPA: hypothetical protein VND68_07940 [Chloroflexia bacterium]|jgi:hypothetical protein|nr:hypothetical protein [Chloroflexia bacterium]